MPARGSTMRGASQRTFSQPTHGSSASIADCAGKAPDSKFHARRRMPELMSKSPSLSRQLACA
jgi:hypothetical protein